MALHYEIHRIIDSDEHTRDIWFPWSSAEHTPTSAASVEYIMHQYCLGPRTVSEDLPSDTFSLPPSKCSDCLTIDRTTLTTILDGVQQTIFKSKIKL